METNLRARLEDLLEVETKRAGKGFKHQDQPMTFTDASRLLNGAIYAMRVLGWAWRWAEWWVEYGSNWEPLLEQGQKEEDFTKEELKIVESTRESRREDARRCRLAAFGAALRNRDYDVSDENYRGDLDFAGGFDHISFERALRAILHTKSLVGPLTEKEIEFYVEWLGRAYRSKSKLLGLGDDKIKIGVRGDFCSHKKDGSFKYVLGSRPLPGKQDLPGNQVFEAPVDEPDDFDFFHESVVNVTTSKPTPKSPGKKRGPKPGSGKKRKAAEMLSEHQTSPPKKKTGKKRGRPPKRKEPPVETEEPTVSDPMENNASGPGFSTKPENAYPAGGLKAAVPLRSKIERGRKMKKRQLNPSEAAVVESSTNNIKTGESEDSAAESSHSKPNRDSTVSIPGNSEVLNEEVRGSEPSRDSAFATTGESESESLDQKVSRPASGGECSALVVDDETEVLGTEQSGDTTSAMLSETNHVQGEVEKKRGPGRPRKHHSAPVVACETEVLGAEPRGDSTPATLSQENREQGEVKKKRRPGRPRKVLRSPKEPTADAVPAEAFSTDAVSAEALPVDADTPKKRLRRCRLAAPGPLATHHAEDSDFESKYDAVKRRDRRKPDILTCDEAQMHSKSYDAEAPPRRSTRVQEAAVTEGVLQDTGEIEDDGSVDSNDSDLLPISQLVAHVKAEASPDVESVQDDEKEPKNRNESTSTKIVLEGGKESKVHAEADREDSAETGIEDDKKVAPKDGGGEQGMETEGSAEVAGGKPDASGNNQTSTVASLVKRETTEKNEVSAATTSTETKPCNEGKPSPDRPELKAATKDEQKASSVSVEQKQPCSDDQQDEKEAAVKEEAVVKGEEAATEVTQAEAQETSDAVEGCMEDALSTADTYCQNADSPKKRARLRGKYQAAEAR
jgi:hypothetical protein